MGGLPYHGYTDLIKHKDKFSSAVFALLILSPFYTFYFYKYCIRAVENLRWFHFLFLISLVLTGCYFISPYVQSTSFIRTRHMRFLFGVGDWIGAFLFYTMCASVLILGLSMLVKYLLQEWQKKKNLG